jgi:hypothetical protein
VASTARAAVTQPVALTCTSVAVVTAMPADSHARHSQMRRDGRPQAYLQGLELVERVRAVVVYNGPHHDHLTLVLHPRRRTHTRRVSGATAAQREAAGRGKQRVEKGRVRCEGRGIEGSWVYQHLRVVRLLHRCGQGLSPCHQVE